MEYVRMQEGLLAEMGRGLREREGGLGRAGEKA